MEVIFVSFVSIGNSKSLPIPQKKSSEAWIATKERY